MVRLGVSVEGESEEIFVKKILKPHLETIEITVVNLKGGINLGGVTKELNRLLNSFDKVTTLYDFYGFDKKDGAINQQELECKISDRVSPQLKHKLIPYIQMYEFEALFFAQPRVIGEVIGFNSEDWGKKILNASNQNPEAINNSYATTPKHRIEEESKGQYRETEHASKILKRIGLVEIRKKCRGFNEWLEQLEKLGE
ncbi:hypothetical protein BHECKSOX_1896 [Bathymodiolus heckerae thiotrophic gill symbiont]|uniref:DUF4276 family protein n=1 Tax=Bathymodiolus heckerae thiotrophic gill symbiont TaxID=1052212 RepID=UPI0010B3C567|nr:DUF4276 family protein [Bathymodiolus heckerae thiotrophic gill symbiont]SHN92939.1 hypothetical protein BHECKSOX_1896 [Bathymodiolus heckerae thiotrophic gill symbiont]